MEYKFTDLVLIVGTSPLPNYVVAEYFIERNENLKKIWLIYSEDTNFQSGTIKFAENIVTLLKEKISKAKEIEFFFVPIPDVENMQNIQNILIQNLNIQDNSNTLHLNFTGGTKTMVVQIYKYISSLPNFDSASYLSARTFSLRDNKQNYMEKDLRPYVKLNIDEMISLNDFKRVNEDVTFDLTKATSLLANYLSDQKKLNNYYKGWGDIKKIFYNKNSRRLKLAQSVIELNIDLINRSKNIFTQEFKKVHNVLPEELKIYNSDWNFNTEIKDENLKFTLEYFDGKWLEIYVYDILKKNQKDFNYVMIEKNREFTKENWKNNRFEIDVILIKGYQLFGISVTTIGNGDKAKIKNKGFEIILRSKQIGGDEARAILITRAGDKLRDDIEEELRLETGGKENIIVLGTNDLKNEQRFLSKVKNFIK